jgi:hypothetical protein
MENKGMQPGDIATWIGAIGTLIGSLVTAGTLIVAFYQIHVERKARKAADEQELFRVTRNQAENVSTWVDHEVAGGSDGNSLAAIAVLNQSTDPIYQVIVSMTAFDYMKAKVVPDEGVLDVPIECRGFVSVVPPGKVFVMVDGNFHGMFFHPAAEIAFMDKSNHYWVRKASGKLLSFMESPVDYYNLARPLGWHLPKTEKYAR